MTDFQFSRSSTGQTFSPVCIGDLDAFDYQVPVFADTEEVAKYLRQFPEVPGVMLTDQGRLVGVIPRTIMFERLGRRYGVELFLRKPILKLKEDLKYESFLLPDHIRVETAVQRAFTRTATKIYDPLVITFEDGRFRLLDMYTLLVVQSQMLENMNGVMNSLGRLDEVLKRDTPEMALKTILDALRQVVPFHHAVLLLLGHEPLDAMQSMAWLVQYPGEALLHNSIYQAIFRNQQSICLDDAQVSPAWVGVNGSSRTRSWMGIPLADDQGFLGILSMSRYVRSPFSNNERDLAIAFAWYLSQNLSSIIQRPAGENFPLQDLELKRDRFRQPALQAVKKTTGLTL